MDTADLIECRAVFIRIRNVLGKRFEAAWDWRFETTPKGRHVVKLHWLGREAIFFMDDRTHQLVCAARGGAGLSYFELTEGDDGYAVGRPLADVPLGAPGLN